MKKVIIQKLLLLITTVLTIWTYSQSSSENYTYVSNCLNEDCSKKLETAKYFDGLGKLKQIVEVHATPNQKDVVIPVEYDGYGRSVKNYLPIPQPSTENGNFISNPFSAASIVYGSDKFYSEKVLEASPLARLEGKISVGNAWANNPSQLQYDTNSSNDAVRKFITDTSWQNDRTFSTIQYFNDYNESELYKFTSTDEDGNIVISFKNPQGQLVLQRKVIDKQPFIDTYYIYNEFDQISFVITPKAVHEFFNNYGGSTADEIPDEILNNLCYQYRFDGRNRLVEKKLPGKGWEYIVYDKQNRVVLYQDANLGKKNEWTFNKYDQFGRIIYTGIYSSSNDYGTQGRIAEQNILQGIGANNTVRNSSFSYTDQSGMQIYYDNSSSYPSNNIRILSVEYYDLYPNYDFSPSFPSQIQNQEILTDQSLANNTSTKGFPVMNLMKNLEDNNWTKTYSYYDKKGRTVATHSINHLGGNTRVESELDFTGVISKSITKHSRLASDVQKTITQTFEYDHQYRLKKHWHQVDQNAPELLTENTYNELSQIVNKKVGNNIQSIDYTYNVRGSIIMVNNPEILNGKLFGYEIKYNNPVYTGISKGKYNGNIAEIDWVSAKDGILKRYSYNYDELNRLKLAFYSEPEADAPQNEYYNESVDYDLNGNITNLHRNSFQAGIGKQSIDNLTYFYTGNRLDRVEDSSNNYLGYPSSAANLIQYDNNGNMIDHLDRGMLEIKYNHLDLPNYVKFDQYVIRDDPFGTGLTTKYKNTSYLYSADGTKLRKTYNYFSGKAQNDVVKTTEYLDGFQYNYDHGGSTTPISSSQGLQFVPTSEGYYDFAQNKYIYHYKDQVGNVRVSFYKNENGLATLDRSTDYYPFGLEFGGSNALNTKSSISPNYIYSFQEQEKQQETGWYSFKWRNYDPAMARFFNVDPLSEVYAYQSHYNFSENRVIDAREIEGLEAQRVDPATFGDTPGGYDGAPEVHSDAGYFGIAATQGIQGIALQGKVSSQSSSSFTWGDVARTGAGFVPIVGSGLDIYEGYKNGNWVQFGFGIGGMVLDVATLGSASIIKGSVKTIGTHLIEEGIEKAAKEAAEQTTKQGIIAFTKKETSVLAKNGDVIIPTLDATGKVHGTLPVAKDLGKYSTDDLKILHQELNKSVQRRIEVTSKLGRDRPHGQRQGSEQDLIKSIEKHLKNR